MDDDLTIRQGDRVRAYQDGEGLAGDEETCATATLPAYVPRQDRGY